MSLFAIGDIHGNIKLLKKMLSHINTYLKDGDTVIFLGDIIDNGNHSKECIEEIINFQKRDGIKVKAIMGNHEEWFSNTKNDFTKHSWILSMQGLRTIESYSNEAAEKIKSVMQSTGPDLILENLPLPYDIFFEEVPQSHIKFFESMISYYETDTCVCSHAGICVDGSEIRNMDEKQLRWGFSDFPDKYTGNKIVIYGHFSKKAVVANGKVKPYIKNNTICLDTQSYGVLSALMLPEKKLIQVKENA